MGLTSSLIYNTGPDGIRDHQASVLDPNTYVGIGTMSPEGTSDLNYLWRPSRVHAILSNCVVLYLWVQIFVGKDKQSIPQNFGCGCFPRALQAHLVPDQDKIIYIPYFNLKSCMHHIFFIGYPIKISSLQPSYMYLRITFHTTPIPTKNQTINQ